MSFSSGLQFYLQTYWHWFYRETKSIRIENFKVMTRDLNKISLVFRELQFVAARIATTFSCCQSSVPCIFNLKSVITFGMNWTPGGRGFLFSISSELKVLLLLNVYQLTDVFNSFHVTVHIFGMTKNDVQMSTYMYNITKLKL